MIDLTTALQIILFPHPTLRRCAKPIRRMDKNLREVAQRMMDLMYEARGVGLAANQVDIPLRMCVVNASGNRGEGEELILINPVLDRPRGSEEEEEGCLSLPGLTGNVVRSKQTRLSAYDPAGNLIDRVIDGFLARVVQHELDHLDGVLFIDRMKPAAARELLPKIEELEIEFRGRQREGGIMPDSALIARSESWEQHYG